MRLRTFCQQVSVAATLLAIAPPALAASSRRPVRHSEVASLSFEGFAEQAGTMFHVRSSGGRLRSLRLIRAERRDTSAKSKPTAVDATFEKFSLVFAGSRSRPLSQDLYTFEHPRLGRFEMFIVPVCSRTPSVLKYEAVFNRPVVA